MMGERRKLARSDHLSAITDQCFYGGQGKVNGLLFERQVMGDTA
jgi:hypothetical protein